MNSPANNSYGQILKSTSLIGGSSLIKMAIGMVRTKFVAVLLGPAGVGLMGFYTAITGMVGTVAGMGISTSGVRQIAEAHGTGDQDQVARTVKSLRRTVWLTGILGLAITILASSFLSRISFGSTDYSLAIALLSSTILMANITAGQSCILQGTRRIADLARVSILGAFAGTMLSIPCYYFWGQGGIVPGLILTATAAFATTWWYARRIHVKPIILSLRKSREDAVVLLRFGIPLMLAGLTTALTAYLIRALLIRQVGLDGVGIWLAAFSISGVLVNFVLGSMGTDYYPRLTAVAHDNRLVSQQVNTQTEIALLLAVPGLAATIIFAPLAITIFYSGKFDAAVNILRWSVYGIFGRVISWPLGFVLLAKGMGKIFFCTEILSNVFYVFAIWLCTHLWGLPGTGIAFLLLYVVVSVVVYAVVNAISRTTWTRANFAHIIIFGALLALVGLISAFVAICWVRWTSNLLILAAISIHCIRRLSHKSGIDIHTLLARFSIR